MWSSFGADLEVNPFPNILPHVEVMRQRVMMVFKIVLLLESANRFKMKPISPDPHQSFEKSIGNVVQTNYVSELINKLCA